MAELIDLTDLLAPPKSERPCAVAAALDTIDARYRDQLAPIIRQMTDNITAGRAKVGKVNVLPRRNLVGAFRRLGQTVSEDALADHLHGRCSCG